jgi:excisionase family DNA binding protein
MKSDIPDNSLVLRQAEAARALGVSTRHLRKLTQEGLVPCVRLKGGRATLYPIDALRKWLADQAKMAKRRARR